MQERASAPYHRQTLYGESPEIVFSTTESRSVCEKGLESVAFTPESVPGLTVPGSPEAMRAMQGMNGSMQGAEMQGDEMQGDGMSNGSGHPGAMSP